MFNTEKSLGIFDNQVRAIECDAFAGAQKYFADTTPTQALKHVHETLAEFWSAIAARYRFDAL